MTQTSHASVAPQAVDLIGQGYLPLGADNNFSTAG